MPLLTNSIDTFAFIWLSGNGPEPPKQILSLVERPAVNGTEIIRLGIKGRPFTLRSGVDCASYADARLLHYDYADLMSADPVDLIVGGQSSAVTQGYMVQVLDVRLVYAGTIGGYNGGLSSGSTAYLECDWDLLPVPI